MPSTQGRATFTALQQQELPSRLLYYPDENHWILTRANSLHWYSEVRQWVEHYAAPGPR